MEITGTVRSAKTKESLGGAKVTLSVGTTEMASLYSDGNGYFAHEETTDYIGETLTCVAEKKGFNTTTLTRRIEEQIIPVEIAMEEEAGKTISPPNNKRSILPKILIGAGIGVVVLALVLVGIFVIPKFFEKKILPPEIVSFTADPSTINKGNQSILIWETENVEEVIIEPIGRRFEPSGSHEVSPYKTTTYILIAMNEEGKEVREKVDVKVKIKILPHGIPGILRPVRPEILHDVSRAVFLPDLYISEFSLSPSIPTQGSPVSVRIGVYNRGSAKAGGFTVEWWAGENFHQPAKVWQVNGLVAKGGRILTYTYNGYPSWYGRLTTKAVADSKGNVKEQNERNNARKMEIQVRKK